MEKFEKTTIFVDGQCIVCDLEVSHYVRLCPERLQAVDIADPRFQAEAHGLDRSKIQKHLHVIDRAGHVHVGVDAFAHIWSEIDSLRWAASLIRKPGLAQLAHMGYLLFAEIRPYLPKRTKTY